MIQSWIPFFVSSSESGKILVRFCSPILEKVLPWKFFWVYPNKSVEYLNGLPNWCVSEKKIIFECEKPKSQNCSWNENLARNWINHLANTLHNRVSDSDSSFTNCNKKLAPVFLPYTVFRRTERSTDGLVSRNHRRITHGLRASPSNLLFRLKNFV